MNAAVMEISCFNVPLVAAMIYVLCGQTRARLRHRPNSKQQQQQRL